MARDKGPAYKPDPVASALKGLLDRIIHTRETIIYLTVAVVLVVLVGAWVVASRRASARNDVLNALALAYDKDDAAVEKVLRENASLKELAIHIIDFANRNYLEAMMLDDTARKAPLLSKAEEMFRLVIDYQPISPLLFLACQGAAFCREESGDKQTALLLFQKALATAPVEMKDKFSYDVGRLLVALGRKQEAVRYLEDATRGEKIYEGSPPGGDYVWRLNARQLLAEANDPTETGQAPKAQEPPPAPQAAPSAVPSPTPEAPPAPPEGGAADA